MNWKLKAAVKTLTSVVPGGDCVEYLAQRYVTRTLPRPMPKIRQALAVADFHAQAACAVTGRPPEDLLFYEFGAGWDLAIPLALWCLGVERQVATDIRKHIRPALVSATSAGFRRLAAESCLRRTPPDRTLRTQRDLIKALHHEHRIFYLAPCDPRAVPLRSHSIDCITSTHTLEHIPRSDLHMIMKECRRLLKPDGVLSFRTDYQDHYSYGDPTISRWNFLRFDANEWKRFNPGPHFQNRLRHSDYLALIASTGFEIIEDEHPVPGEPELSQLATIELASDFQSYSPHDLAVPYSQIVARPR